MQTLLRQQTPAKKIEICFQCWKFQNTLYILYITVKGGDYYDNNHKIVIIMMISLYLLSSLLNKTVVLMKGEDITANRNVIVNGEWWGKKDICRYILGIYIYSIDRYKTHSKLMNELLLMYISLIALYPRCFRQCKVSEWKQGGTGN